MEQDLLDIVNQCKNPPLGSKKRPFKMISTSHVADGSSNPSNSSAPSLQNVSLSVQSLPVQMYKKRKLNKEDGEDDEAIRQKQTVLEYFQSSQQPDEKEAIPFGKLVTDARNSKWALEDFNENFGVSRCNQQQDEKMKELDPKYGETYGQISNRSKKVQALGSTYNICQKKFQPQGYIPDYENNIQGVRQIPFPRNTDHKFLMISPQKRIELVNEEQERIMNTQDKTLRRSSSSVRESKENHQIFNLTDQSIWLEPSPNYQKPPTKKDGKNEDEELICLGGQKDLLFNQRLDDMSEIANQGGQEAIADLSYMDDEQDEPDPLWEVSLLDQFNQIIENERQSVEPVHANVLKRSPSSIKKTNAYFTPINQPQYPTEELVSQQDNTFAAPIYFQPSMQEDSMICDGEGFSQFTQYQASDLLNEGFIADQYSLITEPLAQKKYNLFDGQSTQSPMETGNYPNILGFGRVGKRQTEHFQLNQSF